MFSVIKKILKDKPQAPVSPEESKKKNHLAAGVLLLEAAYVDDECTKEELNHVIETLRSKFELSEECVAELIEVAQKEREEAVDLWEFTNHMNQQYSFEEKMGVMEDVWKIIFADGKLEQHEDHFAHKLGNLLRLSHKEMIEAKLRAREK